jgi:hypothetical protein
MPRSRITRFTLGIKRRGEEVVLDFSSHRGTYAAQVHPNPDYKNAWSLIRKVVASPIVQEDGISLSAKDIPAALRLINRAFQGAGWEIAPSLFEVRCPVRTEGEQVMLGFDEETDKPSVVRIDFQHPLIRYGDEQGRQFFSSLQIHRAAIKVTYNKDGSYLLEYRGKSNLAERLEFYCELADLFKL